MSDADVEIGGDAGGSPKQELPARLENLNKKSATDTNLDMWIKKQVLWTTACHYIIRQIDRLSLAWVTVVLLGGFASHLGHCDFWFLTSLLFLQGVRYAADFTVIVTCNKSAEEIVATGIAQEDDNDPLRRKGSNLQNFETRVSRTLTIAATSCYMLRSATYTLRLLLAALALVNSGVFVKWHTQLLCQTLSSSYVECDNAHTCWTGRPLFSAVLTYYTLMALIAVLYLLIIEGWGWWWTLVSLRKQLKSYELLSQYRSNNDQPRHDGPQHLKGSELTYSQECALRYAYYMYFKCDQMSVSWMLVNTRSWKKGPERQQIVLPWPWVEAVHWLYYEGGWNGILGDKAVLALRLAKSVGSFVLLLLIQPTLLLLLVCAALCRRQTWVPARDEQGCKKPADPPTAAPVSSNSAGPTVAQRVGSAPP